MFVNACFIDQILLTNTFSEKKWHVHSKYRNSFNIQDGEKKQLVVITTTDYPFMPNGIYIDPVYFSAVLSSVEIGEPISWQEDCLHFTKNYLLLNGGKLYSSVMKLAEPVKSTSLQSFNDYVMSVAYETGVKISLADFKEENVFTNALRSICLKEERKKQAGLVFLLGRGEGLTPSGDDMLVGHLAARILLNQQDQKLENKLLTELSRKTAVTTDISKHYLLCALSDRFSAPIIEFSDSLSRKSNAKKIQKAVDNIIKVGHTSGIDLLAGFITTIEYLNNN